MQEIAKGKQPANGTFETAQVADERFAELVAIGKLINDWAAPGEGEAGAGDTLDQEIGVAVEFEDEEEEEGDERDEVVEDDDEEDEDADTDVEDVSDLGL